MNYIFHVDYLKTYLHTLDATIQIIFNKNKWIRTKYALFMLMEFGNILISLHRLFRRECNYQISQATWHLSTHHTEEWPRALEFLASAILNMTHFGFFLPRLAMLQNKQTIKKSKRSKAGFSCKNSYRNHTECTVLDEFENNISWSILHSSHAF